MHILTQRQEAKWKEIFATWITDKELTVNIKNVYSQSTKNNTDGEKWAKDTNRQFTKRDLKSQIWKKIYLTSLIIQNKQIKTKYHISVTNLTSHFKVIVPSTRENVGKHGYIGGTV